MHPGSRVLPPSPQLRQNGGLSVLSSIAETEKIKVDVEQQSRCFRQKKNSLVKKEV
jgi:hypothetical protein